MADITRKEFLEGVGTILGLILVLVGFVFFLVVSGLAIFHLRLDGWIVLGLLTVIISSIGTIFYLIGHLKASRFYPTDTGGYRKSMRFFILQDFRWFLNVMLKINVIILAIAEILCFLSICFEMASPLMAGIAILTIIPLLFVAIYCHLSVIYIKSTSSLSVITVIYTFFLVSVTFFMTTDEFHLTWLSACSILYVYIYWLVSFFSFYLREIDDADNNANTTGKKSRAAD